MAISPKPKTPAQKPSGPPKPLRDREEEELARKKKKEEEEEEEEEDLDDEEEEDEEDEEDEDEEDEDDEEEEDEEDDEEEDEDVDVDEEELDEEEDLEDEDLDDEDLDDEDLDDEDLDDEDDEEDDEDDEDEDLDDDEDDEDEEEGEDEEEEDDEPKRKSATKPKKKTSKGEAAVIGAVAAGAAVGAVAAAAASRKKSSDETQPVLMPASKAASGVAGKSRRFPGAASAAGARSSRRMGDSSGEKTSVRSAQPAKPDKVKAIAIVVCGLLFAAVIGLAAYVFIFKSKTPHKPVAAGPKFSQEAQFLVDGAEKAESLYSSAHEMQNSEKPDDVRKAQKDMAEAVELWNKIADSGKTVPGFEKEIANAFQRSRTVDKEMLELNKKVEEIDAQERIKRIRAQKEHGAASDVGTANTSGPTIAADGIEEIDEDRFKKMEEGDPSQYEAYQKKIAAGKARLKKAGSAAVEKTNDTPKDTAPKEVKDAPNNTPAPPAETPKTPEKSGKAPDASKLPDAAPKAPVE